MSPGSIVEADIANTEATKELHSKIALACDIETVFSRRQYVIGADGAY